MVYMAEGQTNYKMGLVVVVMGEENPEGSCGLSNCFLNFQWMKTTFILLIMYFWTLAQYFEKEWMFLPCL